MSGFQPGDRVVWLKQQRGGYGFIQNVAAVVERVTNGRVVIRSAVRAGSGWRPTIHNVKPEKLRNRYSHVVEVDGLEPDDNATPKAAPVKQEAA